MARRRTYRRPREIEGKTAHQRYCELYTGGLLVVIGFCPVADGENQ